MSSKNRVNPDHYKIAGRDPQGEALRPELQKQLYARRTGAARKPGGRKRPGPAAPARAPGRRAKAS